MIYRWGSMENSMESFRKIVTNWSNKYSRRNSKNVIQHFQWLNVYIIFVRLSGCEFIVIRLSTWKLYQNDAMKRVCTADMVVGVCRRDAQHRNGEDKLGLGPATTAL